MDHLFTRLDLSELTTKGKIFREISPINLDTYAYIVSRMMEAALKGEDNVEFPVGIFSDAHKVADIITSTHPNAVYVNIQDDIISAYWMTSM